LHYGSRAQGRPTGPDSAYDFVVIVSGYREAYAEARATLGERCHPRRAVLLARVLPPNSISLRQPGLGRGAEAKCLVISRADFARECSPRARDHFVQARITQRVLLAWSGNETSASGILESIHVACEHALTWVPIFLPSRFDLTAFCRALIAVPFAHELRAEAHGHESVLYEAQRETPEATFGPVLEGGVRDGRLQRDGDGYRLVIPPGRWQRYRVRFYFKRSQFRTSIRLLKHPFLYEDWLEYLLRKIERHTGQRIELTPRERRHPLVFLWPRTFRFLRSRPQRRGTR